MSNDIKNVIVVGGAGNLGPSVLKALEQDSFTVSVLSRTGSKSKYPSHIKVFEVDESWPEDQLVAAFKGQDAIVQVAFADPAKSKTLIDAAIKAGVKTIIPSEFGSDTSSEAVTQRLSFFAQKQEVLKYLQSKESSGLTWSGIITGAFFDWGLKQKFLGFDLDAKTATIYDGGETPVNYTNLSTVGLAVTAILRNPEKVKNQYVFINSYRVSANEILAALEKATGDKWKVTEASAEKLGKQGGEKLSRGDFSGIGDLIVSTIFSGDEQLDYAKQRGLSNDLLGLPKPAPLDETIAKIVKGEEV